MSNTIGGEEFTMVSPQNKNEPHYEDDCISFDTFVRIITQFYGA
jgi:hypothetical protein